MEKKSAQHLYGEWCKATEAVVFVPLGRSPFKIGTTLVKLKMALQPIGLHNADTSVNSKLYMAMIWQIQFKFMQNFNNIR